MDILIAGSKGQAKDLVSGFFLDNHVKEIVFYDDVSKDSLEEYLFGNFKVIRTIHDAENRFLTKPNFIVAVASPQKRKLITKKLSDAGGKNIRFLSPKALIQSTNKISNEGVMIQIDCIISSDVQIDKGVLINVKCIVLSDVSIGEYTSIAPNVLIQERVRIGKNCIISTGVTILKGVIIGDNVKIWKNKVIDQNVPSNTNFI